METVDHPRSFALKIEKFFYPYSISSIIVSQQWPSRAMMMASNSFVCRSRPSLGATTEAHC